MMSGFPSSQSSITEETIRAYAFSTEDYPIEVLRLACKRFATGVVPGHNNAFMPSAAEISEECRHLEELEKSIHAARIPQNPEHGMINVDFGHGKIDLRDKTMAQVDEIFAIKGLPRIEGAPIQPRIKGMTDV